MALRRHRDRARNFERAGDGDRLMGMTRGFECAAGAVDQHVVEVVVKAGFNDEEMGHGLGLSIENIGSKRARSC